MGGLYTKWYLIITRDSIVIVNGFWHIFIMAISPIKVAPLFDFLPCPVIYSHSTHTHRHSMGFPLLISPEAYVMLDNTIDKESSCVYRNRPEKYVCRLIWNVCNFPSQLACQQLINGAKWLLLGHIYEVRYILGSKGHSVCVSERDWISSSPIHIHQLILCVQTACHNSFICMCVHVHGEDAHVIGMLSGIIIHKHQLLQTSFCIHLPPYRVE